MVLSLPACQRTNAEYRAEIESWHAEHLARLSSEDGWLTLVGLYPLQAGANRIGSSDRVEVQLGSKAPPYIGTVTVAADSVFVEIADRIPVRVRGQDQASPVSRMTLATDAAGTPTVLELGSISFFVIERGDRKYLRVKDSESQTRRSFTGIERFPVSERWRVMATLEAYDPPETISVPNVLGQATAEPSPGCLVFELGGQTCRLAAMTGHEGSLFIVFGDQTNGNSTYDGGRFLSTAPPQPEGTVVLDFNKAINPPCAFTPYATCPLPPQGNVLDVAVQAGEKIWSGKTGPEHGPAEH
jgi:uncharacterized protein (DUF1684 family)